MEKILNAVIPIIKIHEKKEIAEHEKFNIFSILRVSTKEVRMHSAFLADLLNPKGTHGLGNYFLIEFLREINKELPDGAKVIDIRDNESELFSVRPEKRIGKINKDKSIGRQIDIIIESKDLILAIENKIYARDQPNQLERYNKHIEDSGKPGFVVYLTLDKRNMSKYSNKYVNITYKHNIIPFLEKSIVDNELPQVVRNNVNQYIAILNKLTGMSSSNVLRSAVVDKIIENKDFVLAAKTIYDSYGKLESSLLDRYMDKLKVALMSNGENYRIDDIYILVISVTDGYELIFKNYDGRLYVGVRITDNSDVLEVKKLLLKNKFIEESRFAVCKMLTNFDLQTKFNETVSALYDIQDDGMYKDIFNLIEILKRSNKV